MVSKNALFLSLLATVGSAAAFTVPSPTTTSRDIFALSLAENDNHETTASSRRSFCAASVTAVASTLLASASPASATETRQGIEVTPFNGLIFNYRNSQYGGLDASALDEPSVTYKDFCERLAKGEVEFVEFMAPDGDAAYATFKGGAAPIRIGEGYPTEQHDGWSSPAFAVRTVKNAGVPYTFSVPALAKFNAKS